MRTAETGRETKHVRILRWFGVKDVHPLLKSACRATSWFYWLAFTIVLHGLFIRKKW
jgi:hypothetical protein